MAERSDINDRELLASRILRAAPATVFEFWTDPANISEWWGPDGFATTTHAMDLRAGGEWLFTMHGPGGQDYKSRVEFLEVTRPSRLVYLHRDRDELEPVRFHATVTFAALGEKTLLTMRMVFESAEDLARTEDAYGASDGLLRTLARFTESLAAHSQTERVVAPRSDRELATSRTIGAPPERVFDAFRDPEKLARW